MLSWRFIRDEDMQSRRIKAAQYVARNWAVQQRLPRLTGLARDLGFTLDNFQAQCFRAWEDLPEKEKTMTIEAFCKKQDLTKGQLFALMHAAAQYPASQQECTAYAKEQGDNLTGADFAELLARELLEVWDNTPDGYACTEAGYTIVNAFNVC